MIDFTDEQVYDVATQVGCTIETARAVMEAAIALLGNNPETFEKLADEKRWQ